MTVHNVPHHDDHQAGEDETRSDNRRAYDSHTRGSPRSGCPEPNRSGGPDTADAPADVPIGDVRALGQTVSGIAHDLTQSLALIAGYAELLERELATPS